MMKNNLLNTILIVIGLLAVSCKNLETTVQTIERPLPEAFSEVADSTREEKPNWKSYFSDSMLIALIDTALTRNYDLQISLQRIEMARSGVRFAKGEQLPMVDGVASLGTTRYGKFTESGQGNATTPYPDDPNRMIPNPVQDYYFGVQASWEADVFGRLKNQKRAAVAAYLSSVDGTQFVITNLIAEIAGSYYDLLALDEELEIVLETIHKQEEALDVIMANKEAGRANTLAVQQFQAQLLDTRGMERSTRQRIAQTENRINFLMGRYPQAIVRSGIEAGQGAIPLPIHAGIPSDLLENRADIREARQLVEASRFDVKAAKAAFFPSFTINAGLGMQAFRSDVLFDQNSLAYGLLGQLTAPLLNRSAIKAQFGHAKANQLEAMYQYQQTVLNGYVEVYNELIFLDNQQEIVRLNTEESEVLQSSVDIAYELYKSGMASYLEVLFAQQNALNSRLELIQANRDLQISVVNLYRALGGGWE